jgi:NADPH:quinone reductase
MKAALIEEYGADPVIGEATLPGPEQGREAVEVELAGLNPVDIAIASGKFDAGAPDLPYTPGLEGIGVLADGRRVWFDRPSLPVGSFAGRCVIDPSTAVELPGGVKPEEAIPFGVAGMAAWLGLDWRGGLKQGESVLVLGSSGVVGQIAVQGARILGAGRVAGAARSESGRSRSLELGADAVTATSADSVEQLAEAFRDATGGGPDLVLDGLWGDPARAALLALKPGGRLVQVGNSAAKDATVAAGPLRGTLASLLGHRNFHAPVDVQAAALRTMCELGSAGRLELDVEVIPLDRVAEAWQRQKQSPGVKIAVRP